jgi:hypothetical protein
MPEDAASVPVSTSARGAVSGRLQEIWRYTDFAVRIFAAALIARRPFAFAARSLE